jgi:phage gpG-like protein
MRGLEDLRRRMAAVASPGLRRDIAANCAEAAVKLIDDGFRTSTDPYGKPWAPLKSRVGKPLLDTRTHLQGRLAPRVTGSGFTISTSFVGAPVHQYGATIKAKTAVYRFGGAGSAGQDMVTAGKPMLRFKVGGRGKKGRWVSKEQVTIPRRQYMPEDYAGPRWERGINDAATDTLMVALGGDF